MDKIRIAFDASPSMRTKDENGFLKVARSHITKETVNPYYGREIPSWRELGLDPEEVYYGYRSGKELEKAARTFDGLPLLLGHHVESADDPQKEHRVGSLGTDAEYIKPYLDNSLFVTDAKAIEAIENGTSKEISCAYMYEPDFHSGEFNGVPYDFVMRNIRGNHVALVEEGRAGADVVVADAQISPKPEGGNMKKGKKFRGAADSALSPEAIEKVLGIITSICDVSDEQKAQLSEKLSKDKEPDELPEDEAVEEKPVTDEGEEKPMENEDEPVNTHEAVNAAEKSQEEPVTDEEEKMDIDEKEIKAVADKCGIQYDEDFSTAFKEGMSFAEKHKAAHEDMKEEEEKIGEDEDMEEEKPMEKGAMDAAIKRAKDAAIKQTREHFRSISDAVQTCRSVLGNVDSFAFDSAEQVYGKALRKCGINPAQHPKSAWRSMFAVIAKTGTAVRNNAFGMAQDSAFSVENETKFEGPFEGLNRIHR